ncbi:iron export ABC transporter permease subunit FetB [Aeribacillus sp. FSL K6-2848]|uniref:ABC transporter permease n=1 Tax=Aeribacillus sp. FSL K6-2848 TaxID=2954612 RepID=UPI0030F92A57
MENGVINIEFWRLISAYLFIVILLWLTKRRGINREKRIIIATIRMSVQLMLVGYILMFIFDHPSPWIVFLIIFLMESFAVYNIYKQLDTPLTKKLKFVIAFSMIAGSIACLFYFNLVVIHFKPWYEPRYFIPIAGMFIGNSMTGITLGMKQMVENFSKQKHIIEGALMLGAKPEKATKDIVNSSFDSAILPTINNMIGMGIVFLPGMMTGQILAGASPLVAIEYQIAILIGIAGSVGISSFLALQFGYKTFFNDRVQFLPNEKNEK